MILTRTHIVAAARGWIGTPYRHQASLKGIGTDCLGLVRGVWREVLGEEPERPPAYGAGWLECRGELLAEAARRHMQDIPCTEFRRRRRAAVPLALQACRRGTRASQRIAATWCMPRRMPPPWRCRSIAWWLRHLAHAFRFPGLAC